MVVFFLGTGRVTTCDLRAYLRLAKPEVKSITQVDVTRKSATVSPLSLRERARVRAPSLTPHKIKSTKAHR